MFNPAIVKISRPFANSFNTLLGGEVVSYSKRARKIAIGNDAVVISDADMQRLDDTSNAYGDQWHLAISLWNQYAGC